MVDSHTKVIYESKNQGSQALVIVIFDKLKNYLKFTTNNSKINNNESFESFKFTTKDDKNSENS